jgi:23S rRNA (adenine2503-C2)-methyltransferase
MQTKSKIKNLSAAKLAEAIENLGEPKYRAKQIMEWLYAKNAASFDEMSALPKTFRERLAESFEVDSLKTSKVLTAKDGASKYAFVLRDGERIESVLIPDKDRLTLCVSSQAGCALGCRYCLTGAGGFIRNLEAAEILDQIIAVRRSLDPGRRLTNLVFMGMGEPFLNFDNLVRALKIITSPEGMGFSPHRITVSTSGITDKFDAFGRFRLGELAVSLNATEDKTRSAIMPINKKYPIRKIIDACRNYPGSKWERLTIEYVLIAGVNDSGADASRLAGLLAGIPCKINLIPFNEFRGSDFKTPAPEAVDRFREGLLHRGLDALVRRSRGAGISAACGSLGGKNVAKKRT